MTIHFLIRFHTEVGQSLFITGDIEELGNDSVENAFPLSYLNHDYWHGTIDVDTKMLARINYKYIFQDSEGIRNFEGGEPRQIDLGKTGIDSMQVIDRWMDTGAFENAFQTAPFRDFLLKENETRVKPKSVKKFSHLFRIKAPLLQKNEVVCLVGNGDALNNWNVDSPILLTHENNWWQAKLSLTPADMPLTYKYGIYNIREKAFLRFETGENRFLQQEPIPRMLTILHDGFIQLPADHWKGAGVSIPVFSLRSRDSFGIGEFSDLKLLADWAKRCGLKLIQILPVNDTSATSTWVDSYPYASISAFALHPIYLNLELLAGKKHAELIRPLRKKQKQLNELPEVDYEQVLKFKLSTIRELFTLHKEEFLKDKKFLSFFEASKHWLIPYAAFCYLRDRNGTSDFTTWKLYSKYDKNAIEKYVSPRAKHFNEIALHYYIQYHLHLQLSDAADYAHKNGIILKGDIPIGIYRYGCDAWVEPELYHMDHQAGAPPDAFAVKGQNWGFPTYNWEQMEKDGFNWWRRRFVHMSNYFDAFRIDHILGFFRIWSIPLNAVEGIMGYFVPAVPVHINEFAQRGMWFNYHRLCKPYINEAILWEFFGPNKEKFYEFLNPTGNYHFDLKEEFDSQRKVEAHFSSLENTDDNRNIRQGLYDLISNVILFEHSGSEGQQFHFRFAMDTTASFRHLDPHMQYQVKELYVDYFYRRQDDFWRHESLKKLPALKQSTNMLVCGEDLGMVPKTVPDVMQKLGILSLEIQRMPKNPEQEFFHPANAPYLSVVTPSTHDMSTVRGWWEEDPETTQHFYNRELGQEGHAPRHCEAWINRTIVLQHLYSPAMWSIFQLQDLLGSDEKLRRDDPHAERINEPSNPTHYWRYRMHLYLEDLIKEKEFNAELKEMVNASGR